MNKKRSPQRSSKKNISDRALMRKSVVFGSSLGAVFGALIGAAFGAITTTLNGILVGLGIGLVLGILTGALTSALTVKTAGTTGGVSIGAYTGMVLGGVLGMVLGVLIPTSLRMSANTEGMPVLDALMLGRFETAILSSFLLSILGTIVGAWIGGRNLVPRNLKLEIHGKIDQYDLIEVIRVPETRQGVINLGDIGVVVEKYDDENFQIECVRPDGTYEWLETLNIKYVKLKQKIPDNM
ncbi:MAG TPA: hypothetical protein VK897_11540 [Anaerolineales bacterium]|nr:hypothetical protein [Anaerolineales bacterium]